MKHRALVADQGRVVHLPADGVQGDIVTLHINGSAVVRSEGWAEIARVTTPTGFFIIYAKDTDEDALSLNEALTRIAQLEEELRVYRAGVEALLGRSRP